MFITYVLFPIFDQILRFPLEPSQQKHLMTEHRCLFHYVLTRLRDRSISTCSFLLAILIHLRKAMEIPSVVYLNVHARKGDLSLFANNGGDAIIDGILSNKDPEQLQKDIIAVQSLVKINIKKVKEYEVGKVYL